MPGLNHVQDVALKNAILFLKGNFTIIIIVVHAHCHTRTTATATASNPSCLHSQDYRASQSKEGFHGTYIKKITLNIYKLKQQ